MHIDQTLFVFHLHFFRWNGLWINKSSNFGLPMGEKGQKKINFYSGAVL